MPSTYTPIGSTTVSESSTTTVTFSSIPSTYTDLVIVATYKAAGNNYLMLRFNGDTGNNYSRIEMQGLIGSTATTRLANEPYAYISSVYAPKGEWALFTINIPSYSNTNTHKTVLSRGSQKTVGTSAVVNSWRSNAAISTILITPIGTGFDVESTFTLYGIKAA